MSLTNKFNGESSQDPPIKNPGYVNEVFKRKLCLWQQMKRYPHESDLSVRYKQLTLDCRAAVRDFESKQEIKLIDSHNINNLYKYINRKLRSSSSCPVLYDQTGSCVYSDLDKAELFNAHFHSVNVDDTGNLPKFSRRAEANIKLDTVQFTAEKIHKVIKRLKPKMTRDPESCQLQTCVNNERFWQSDGTSCGRGHVRLPAQQ